MLYFVPLERHMLYSRENKMLSKTQVYAVLRTWQTTRQEKEKCIKTASCFGQRATRVMVIASIDIMMKL